MGEQLVSALLVSGSRYWEAEDEPIARDYVTRVIARAKETGKYVLVGDAPGVDKWVIDECEAQGVPVTIYRPHGKALRYTTQSAVLAFAGNSYASRDRYMVHRISDLNGIVLGVWNGQSTGTRRVLSLARMAYIPLEPFVWSPRGGLRKW